MMQNPLITSWILLVFAAINSTIGNILIKKSQSGLTHTGVLDSFLNIWFLSGIFFYVINLILFSRALNNLPISIAYPTLASLGFLFLSIAAHYFLDENLSSIQILGMTFSICGIFMMTYR
jgi:small multidrug resistance pump